MEEYGPDIITVVDDDGAEHEFEELDRIETDDGNRYIAVTPVYDSAEEMLEDSGELIVLKVLEENEEPYLEAITDEAEFDDISSVFMERLENIYDFEEED